MYLESSGLSRRYRQRISPGRGKRRDAAEVKVRSPVPPMRTIAGIGKIAGSR